MQPTAKPPAESFQAQFHRRWNHLANPHVRALAWLLDSPDLLDAQAPQWYGKIATLANVNPQFLGDWLLALDRNPTALEGEINRQPTRRLGRYAEKLMAFYFQQQGILIGHGVQVQDGNNGTVGEFDFLLREQDALLHWEFATKFYLQESDLATPTESNFVGPNLADNLAAKMAKIFGQQLLLAEHPSAQIHLPHPVKAAQALVKGWLFYRKGTPCSTQMSHVSSRHCYGFWCTLSEWKDLPGDRVVILPKLQWLAPAKVATDQINDRTIIDQTINLHFENGGMPVLVSFLEQEGDFSIETTRGFIVSDDWPERARRYANEVTADKLR